MAPRTKKAPKAPTAPVVEPTPVVEPVVEPTPLAGVLADVLKVKNKKGKEFEVTKDYYLTNNHKLELI